MPIYKKQLKLNLHPNNKKDKACSCGNREFFAHQVVHDEIVVDHNNSWLRTTECYYADTPFGPFLCTDCGTQYDDLEEL